jgi:hypothetical protein
MRWRPSTAVCEECGFDWRCDREQALAVVARGPADIAEALQAVPDPAARGEHTWSASIYVWHLVDVLRIGTERLLTLLLDPAAGIPCWDENALAEVRRYAALSPAVGASVLGRAARDFEAVAVTVPDDAEVEHPVFGAMGALEIVRRNAHEVRHHLGDVVRWSAPGPKP